MFWKYLEFVPVILSNYKKRKRTQIFIFTASSFLNAQCVLVATEGDKFRIYYTIYLEFFSLILCNYKKLKRTKIFIFTTSSFLNAQYILVLTVEKVAEKQRSVPVVQVFYISFNIEFKICPLNITLLKKIGKTLQILKLTFSSMQVSTRI